MSKPIPKEIELTPEDSLGKSVQLRKKKKRSIWPYFFIFILLIGALWLWKQVELTDVKEEAERERQSIQQQAKRQLVEVHAQHLRLLAKPFVWALREEMMLGNISQVHLFLNEMAREKNFKYVLVADDKGTIVSSTFKPYEGRLLNTVAPENYLAVDTTTVDFTNDSTMVMSSPIMGFNNRVGTLVAMYNIPPRNIR